MNGSIFGDGIPGLKNFSLAQVLHGEQYVELLKPLPSSGLEMLYSITVIEFVCIT